MTDATLTLKFGADTSDLKDGIARAASAVNGFGSQVYGAFQNAGAATNSFGQRIGSLASGAIHEFARLGSGAGVAVEAIGGIAAASAVAASVAAAALGAIAASAVNFGMAVGHSAAQLGDTTENISEFVPVANAAGMSLDALATKFTAIGAKLDANDKSFQNALKALKINPATFNAAGALDQMNMLQAHVSSLGDSYTKTAALQVLFGTSAAQMEPLLNRSTASFKGLEQEARRTGTVMSGALIDGMRGTQSIIGEIKDRLDEGKLAMTGLAMTAYGVLKPAIDSILDDFAKSTLGIDNFIESLNQGGSNSAMFVAGLQKVKDALADFIIAYRTAGAAIQAYAEKFALPFLKIGAAIAEGLASGWSAISTFFSNLANAATEVARGIAQTFADVGQAIASGITGHFAEAHAAFGKLQSDAVQAAAGMRAALSHPIPAVDNMVAKVTQKASDDWASFQATLVATAAKTRADLNKEWSKPISAPSLKGQTAGAMPVSDNGAALRGAQAKIDGEIALLQAGLGKKKAIYAQEVVLGNMSQAQMVAATKAAMEQEYQAELQLLQKEATLGGLKVAQQQQILNKIAVLQVTHDTQMIAESTKAMQKVEAEYKKAFDKIGNVVSQNIMGMIADHERFRQMARNILLMMIQDEISTNVQKVANWLGMETQKTVATMMGNSARTGSDAAAGAASAMIAVQSVMQQVAIDARAVFAGIFGFLAPIMGPGAAGPAAAGAATVLGGIYADGSWQIPSDQLAQLHQGEMVVPAAHTPWAQSLMANGGPSGGTTNNNFSPTVHYHAHGSTTAEDLRSNASTLVKVLQQQHRRGAFTGGATR